MGLDEFELGISEDVVITLPKGQRDKLKANFELDEQLQAPLSKGQHVGTVYLQLNGEDVASFPLVTLQAVEEGGFFKKMMDYIKQQFTEE